TLGTRPHLARSACVAGGEGLGALWRVVAHLVAERVPLELSRLYAPEPEKPAQERVITGPVGGESFAVPDEPIHVPVSGLAELAGSISAPIGQTVAVVEARGQAHAAYLRYSETLRGTFAATLAFQGMLFERALAGGTLASRVASAPGGASLPALTGPGSPAL